MRESAKWLCIPCRTLKEALSSIYRRSGPFSKNNSTSRMIVYKGWARFHPVLALRPTRHVVLFRMINNPLMLFSLSFCLSFFLSFLRFNRFVCLATRLSICLFIRLSFLLWIYFIIYFIPLSSLFHFRFHD
jgi:hypothetical protein